VGERREIADASTYSRRNTVLTINDLIAELPATYTLSQNYLLWLRTCNSRKRSMDQLSILAAGGMRARLQSLDMLANNIANTSTGGYKSDSEFYSLYTSEIAEDESGAPNTKLPLVEKQWTDFSQGLLEPTNSQLDFALSGKGFFAVQGPSGPLYTRNGSFQVSNTGALTTADGYALLDSGGQPLQAKPKQPVELSIDGGLRQNGQLLGQLKLVNFKDPSVLTKQGNNYFTNTSKQDPEDATDIQVHQGKIESSNVSPSQAAVRLVSVMRQFEMMQKAVTVSSDMSRKVIEEVAKV
jgi:flagellar basal-body rod protein FlgF